MDSTSLPSGNSLKGDVPGVARWPHAFRQRVRRVKCPVWIAGTVVAESVATCLTIVPRCRVNGMGQPVCESEWPDPFAAGQLTRKPPIKISFGAKQLGAIVKWSRHPRWHLISTFPWANSVVKTQAIKSPATRGFLYSIGAGVSVSAPMIERLTASGAA